MNTPIIDEMVNDIVNSNYPPTTTDMVLDMIHDVIPYEYSEALLCELNRFGASDEAAKEAMIEVLYQSVIIEMGF